jgi:hypothetical protein
MHNLEEMLAPGFSMAVEHFSEDRYSKIMHLKNERVNEDIYRQQYIKL